MVSTIATETLNATSTTAPWTELDLDYLNIALAKAVLSARTARSYRPH
jgi:hypothetical protein